MERAQQRAVVGKRGAARARGGHPWIYRSDIAEANGEAGDVVPVFDGAGTFLGRAFYNPRSEISLRMAELGDTPVDESWFRTRIERAVAYRDSLKMDGDAYRLLHAEADGVPGLVVDRYGDHLVLQVGSAAVEKRLEWVVRALGELLSPAGILLRGDSASRKREGLDTGVRVLSGEVPDAIVVREGPRRLYLRRRLRPARSPRRLGGRSRRFERPGSGCGPPQRAAKRTREHQLHPGQGVRPAARALRRRGALR